MTKVIVFDVVGTLLDLSPLDPHFERNFGSAEARKDWFQTLQQLMFASTATGSYAGFNRLAKAALQMTAEIKSVTLSVDQRSVILNELKNLPPYPDVEEGLRILRDAGLRLAALTNGKLQAAHNQLRNATLTDYFEKIMSADEVKRLKPAREPYEMAAKRLKVKIGEFVWWRLTGGTLTGPLLPGVRRRSSPERMRSSTPLAPNPGLTGMICSRWLVKSSGRTGMPEAQVCRYGRSHASFVMIIAQGMELRKSL